MATHGQAPVEPPPVPEPAVVRGKLLEYDQFIEAQLRKTRSYVRNVDIAASLMVLVAFTLAYFLLAALVDHWIIPGGLDFWGRLSLWVIYVGTACYWVVTQILPLLVKRINPLYAADTIERSRPTLKNTLLNFLIFRANPAGVHEKVLNAIEMQAATKLAGVHVESAVDRTRLIRLGYVLVGILIVGAAYALLSPKDLFKTVGRVAMPWSDISVPTRTTINEITPGDAKAFRGQQVQVQARVDGLPDDGKILLYYSTADRQIVDRAVEMSRSAGQYHHLAMLPAGDSALEQTLSYRIEAGDAVTRTYSIEVVAAPTIVVQSLDYQYPEYTSLISQRVEHQGDIKAIEGTRVTVEALANQDIDAAHIDFDCDNTLDLRMRVEEQTAQGTFTLSLGEDRQTPTHSSYQVIFKNSAGRRNPQPVRHQISVTRDIAPEVQFAAPRQDEIDLPLDAALDLEIVAGDPDFALSRVTLSGAKAQETIIDQPLLEETWRGQFSKKYRFDPKQLGLEAGDVVDYWAVAVDNKDPQPNQTETSRRRIRIVSASGREGTQDQLAQNEKREDRRQPQSDDPHAGDNDHPRAGDPVDDKLKRDAFQPPNEDAAGGDGQDENAPADDRQPGQPQDAAGGDGPGPTDGQSGASDQARQQQDAEPGVPNDGTNDGEAIERILEHQKQTGQDQDQPADRGEQGDGQKQNQERGDQQGAQDAPSKGNQQRRPEEVAKESDPNKEQQPDAKPDDAGQQQGSGANQGGKGNQSAQKQPGDKNQQQRGAGQSQEQQGSGEQQPGEPDKANRGKPGDSKSPSQSEQGTQGGDGSQQKPQRGNNTGQQQPGGTKDTQSSGEEGQGQSEKQPSDGAPSPNPRDVGRRERGEGSDPQAAERQGDGKPNKPDPNRQSTGDTNTRKDGTPQDPSTKGQGANSNEDPLRGRDQKPPQREAQKPDARGGDGENSKGPSGGGQKTDDNEGSPTQREEHTRPKDKNAQTSPDDKEQKPDGEAQSGSTSDRESETEGEQDGEHSGGGRRGGGQKANQPGTGGAGQNTAADEGAGRSDDAGDGETSDRAGGDRQSDGKTGQSGSKTGPGSRTKPSDGENEKSGGQSNPQDASDSPSGRNAPGKGAEGGEQSSRGQPTRSNPQDRQWAPSDDKADKANLEYARKATDLALEHLQDQLDKGEPDPELLDKLGWTRGDLEKFVKRWEAMRARAQTPSDQGTDARRELDETLRSLGLRPRSTTLNSNEKRDDRMQGYQEAARTTPPAEYSESFKAYTQGTARGGK